MRKIILNSGKTFDCPLAGEDEGVLWLTLAQQGLTVAKAVEELSESACRVITWNSGSGIVKTWEGYTKLAVARQKDAGWVEIALLNSNNGDTDLWGGMQDGR